MKKITISVLSVAALMLFTLAPLMALSTGNCCNGQPCCHGQACCHKK